MSALVILTNECILNSNLVQIIFEQEGGDKRVVIVWKGSSERNRSSSLSRMNRKSRMQCTAVEVTFIGNRAHCAQV